MRRLLSMICVAVALLTCTACSKDNTKLKEPVTFYYCNREISYNSSSGVIRSELREGESYQKDPVMLINDYLSGPLSSELDTLIPAGTTLRSFIREDDVAYLEFSNEFAELSGVRLSTACSCIVMTLHDYAGTETVNFRVSNGQLENKDELIMRVSDIIFMDNVSMKG